VDSEHSNAAQIAGAETTNLYGSIDRDKLVFTV